MQRYKSLVLPVALVLGFFLRQICAVLSVAIPYVIFAILVLTFSGVRLASLRPSKLDFVIAAFQTLVSFGLYWFMMAVTSDEILAQGAMMCVLCPVASSSTVVAAMLGANPRLTTSYTIVGNLLVCVIAPVYISMISEEITHANLIDMFSLIFAKISFVIAVPFILVLCLQKFTPKINVALSRFKQLSFYLWAFALLVTIGQTIDFVCLKWYENVGNVVWLGVISMLICVGQFVIGKMIGENCGDRVAGGQMLAQKNSAMGIWMLNTFLNPIASVGMAFYSIWQNLFNSWQIYRSK